MVDEPEKEEVVKKKRFRKHKKPRHHKSVTTKETNKGSKGLIGDEITIKFHPKHILKIFIFLIILIAVFYLGRFSVTVAECPNFSLSSFIGSSDNVSVEDQSVTDTDLDSVKEEIEVDEAELDDVEIEDTTDTEGDEELSADETDENSTEPVAGGNDASGAATAEPASDEVVVTSYSNVAIALDNVFTQWKGTWGKITGIGYTIKNNEAGTVKPSYFIILVEGYDDMEKKFNVGYKSQKITSSLTLVDSAAVSGGFAYNEVTAGDLNSVEINLFLYDAAGKQIATVSKNVDLSGE